MSLENFVILGPLTGTETIATGQGIRELATLQKKYGKGRWRKRIGKRKLKIKYLLD